MGRILVIDDSTEVHDLVRQAIGRDHEVFAVTSWADAGNLLFRGRMDLVLLDVNMPVVTGDRIAEIVSRSSLAPPRIVLFSAMDEGDLRRIARRVKAAGYLPKTFDPETLRRRLMARLETGTATPVKPPA